MPGELCGGVPAANRSGLSPGALKSLPGRAGSGAGAPGGASGSQAPLLAAPARGPRPAAQSTWSRRCRPALPTPGGAPGRWPSRGEARRGPRQLRLLEDTGGTGGEGDGGGWTAKVDPFQHRVTPACSGEQELQQLDTGRLATRPRGPQALGGNRPASAAPAQEATPPSLEPLKAAQPSLLPRTGDRGALPRTGGARGRCSRISPDAENRGMGQAAPPGHQRRGPAPYLWHRGQRRSARVCG